jgi:hypothetical protein
MDKTIEKNVAKKSLKKDGIPQKRMEKLMEIYFNINMIFAIPIN